jgi:hypothetical protein
MFLNGKTLASDNALQNLCLASFSKESNIPSNEQRRFCLCVSSQALPGMNSQQKSLLKKINEAVAENNISDEILASIKSGGITNKISEANEYCNQQYYSVDRKSINGTNGFELSVFCNIDTHNLTISLSAHNNKYKGHLSSPASFSWEEIEKSENQKIVVEYMLDGLPSVKEYWNEDTNFTNYLLESPEPDSLWVKMSKAKKMTMKIVDTQKSVFFTELDFIGQFPSGWQACKPDL